MTVFEAQMPSQPTPDDNAVRSFCDLLFDGASGYAAVRLLPENRRLDAKPSTPFEPVGLDLADSLIRHVHRAAKAGQGAFILPGTVTKPGGARAEDVVQLTAIVVDIDEGDIGAKREHLVVHLGPPTLEVASGGISGDGQPRLHLYWRLETPASGEAVGIVCRLRRAIALKVGADPSFGSAHQPIRIPGSLNRKNGGYVPTEIMDQTEGRVDLEAFAAAVDAMPTLPSLPSSPTQHAGSAASGTSVPELLNRTIRAGGVDGINRFDALSTVIGHYVRKVRLAEMPLDEAWQAVRSYNQDRIDPPASNEELRRDFERLRQVDARNHGVEARTGAAGSQHSDDLDGSGVTEDALADRFSRTEGTDWRFCVARAIWLHWDGCCWRQDDLGRVRNVIRNVCREAAEGLPDRQAMRIAAERTVSAVERLARSDPRHATAGDAWDAAPMLFNTANGIIDLETGELRPHDRACLMSRIAPAKAQGECLTWLGFLGQITDGDAELQAYLQRVAGYALTGRTTEQAFFFLHGHGANGKSVFLTAIGRALGDYATSAPLDAFMASRSDRHPVELADLQGARLVMIGETEADRAWAETRLKTVTGGEAIRVRHLYQRFFTYTPTFKLIVAGNHRPAFQDTGEAMRRRLHLVPFDVTIPEGQRDQDLAARLEAERNGILAWMIEGCLEWQKRGLDPPEAVRRATDDYFQDEDQIGQWLAACCFEDRGASTPFGQLFANYRTWAEQIGEPPVSQKAFSQGLKRRGYSRGRGRVREVRGLGLAMAERDVETRSVS